MNSFMIIIALASLASSALALPLPTGTNVNVQQSTDGSYTFHFMGIDSSRLEERKPDGTVSGYYTFIDTDGISHTIHYSSGPSGFIATGSDIPAQVVDLPEVANARFEHVNLVQKLRAELPPLGQDGLVPEVEPVPLTKEEFLAAVSQVLGRSHLSFSEDTPEIAQGKFDLINAHKKALGF
ncbi:uncharacterized protein [Onthophagus taurus]|uniref:uncharacterized protein n=1 Tax=Onthophagus taurus TaxID=166361 RepID=UPI0039BE58E0